jgi:hypothetical protein
MSQCRARNQKGDQCGNNAIPGTNYCYLESHGANKEKSYKRVLNFLRNRYHWLIELFLAVLSFVLYFHDENISATSGHLSTSKPAVARYIGVGSARFMITSTDGIFIRDEDGSLVSIHLLEGVLSVSTIIKNSKGEIVAILNDNEWSLNKNTMFDRNYTNNVLEVKDNKGEIVLQIVNFGDIIHFAGLLRCNHGYGIFLGYKRQDGFMAKYEPNDEPSHHNHSISPICEYPSDRHLGSCPGLDSLNIWAHSIEKGGYRMDGSIKICDAHPKTN